MISLKEALKMGRLAQFIEGHKRDPKGDAEAAEKIIRSMAGKSKPARKTSSRDGSDD